MKPKISTITSLVLLAMLVFVSRWTGPETQRDEHGHRLVRGSLFAWQYARQISAAAKPNERSRDFVREIQATEPEARVARLYHCVHDRWTYTSDPEGGRDWLRFSEEMIDSDHGFRGDCEDFAILMLSLLQSFDEPLDCRIVLAGPETDDRPAHAYVEIRICDPDEYPANTAEQQEQLSKLQNEWNIDELTIHRDTDGIWLALDDFPPTSHKGRRKYTIKPDGTLRKAQ